MNSWSLQSVVSTADISNQGTGGNRRNCSKVLDSYYSLYLLLF